MVLSKSGLISLSFLVALVGCGQGADAPSGESKAAAAPTASAGCAFESTKDSSPLLIKAVATDTPEAKEFLETCINPYTKIYAADAEAAKAGKKKFGYYSCTQCHGPNGDGQVAVSKVAATHLG
jgi:mono/diheme cytochrome c family protein